MSLSQRLLYLFPISESHFPPLFPLTSRFCGVFLVFLKSGICPPFFATLLFLKKMRCSFEKTIFSQLNEQYQQNLHQKKEQNSENTQREKKNQNEEEKCTSHLEKEKLIEWEWVLSQDEEGAIKRLGLSPAGGALILFKIYPLILFLLISPLPFNVRKIRGYHIHYRE